MLSDSALGSGEIAIFLALATVQSALAMLVSLAWLAVVAGALSWREQGEKEVLSRFVRLVHVRTWLECAMHTPTSDTLRQES